MFAIESAKLTGTGGTGGWAQVHEFVPDNSEKLAKRGHFFAVISTSRVEEGVETVSAGRELLSRLHEEYFGSVEAKPFNALQIAVEKVSKEFKEMWGDVEIIASAIVGEVVYSALFGRGKVMICRDGATGTILSGEGGVVASSGFPKEEDTILMATSSFFKNISQGAINAALVNETAEGVIESFAPIIRSTDNLGNLGAAILKFTKKSEGNILPEAATTAATPQIVTPKLSLNDLKNQILGQLNKFSLKFPQKSVYVKSPFEDEAVGQSKKLTFSVAIILILILIVSIGLGIRQKKINDVKNKYQGLLLEASSEVDQAISLASVSPDKSRELFVDSEAKLAQIENLHIKDAKIDELKSKIDESRASVLGEYLFNPELFLDLTLLSSGFKGDTLSASGGKVFILDKSGKRIVSVAISNKKSKVVAGPSVIDTAEDLASYQDNVFVLGGDGIYEVGTTKTKVVDKTWAGDALIKAFAGNLYVLDKSGNSIYRYQGNGDTFGDKQGWLAAGTRVDFSDTSQWTIDGAVYTLFPNSKMLKFNLGSPQNFAPSGVIPEIGHIDSIYADPDNQGIYFLDKAGHRVVVTDKKGKYVAQYIGDQLSQVTGLVVSETDKKIILLTGDKLFSVDIRHL